jgi:ABC-type glycerol-3-phosphate transport system substrate-binding protein
MNKLLSLLIAGFFAAGAAMAQTSTSGSGALSGSVSGSKSDASSTNTNTNTATSTNANVNANTNTNTNNVNVYGPGSNKLARQQAASGSRQPSTDVSMMPGKGKTTDKTTTAQSQAKSCPPGLEKKDNGCLPPGQAKKQRSDTRVMGHTATRDRHHRDQRRNAG